MLPDQYKKMKTIVLHVTDEIIDESKDKCARDESPANNCAIAQAVLASTGTSMEVSTCGMYRSGEKLRIDFPKEIEDFISAYDFWRVNGGPRPNAAVFTIDVPDALIKTGVSR
jgi:hypothetical protein